MTTNNTLAQKATRRKLNLLEPATDLAMSAKHAGVSGIPESIFMKFAETIKPSVTKDF